MPNRFIAAYFNNQRGDPLQVDTDGIYMDCQDRKYMYTYMMVSKRPLTAEDKKTNWHRLDEDGWICIHHTQKKRKIVTDLSAAQLISKFKMRGIRISVYNKKVFLYE